MRNVPQMEGTRFAWCWLLRRQTKTFGVEQVTVSSGRLIKVHRAELVNLHLSLFRDKQRKEAQEGISPFCEGGGKRVRHRTRQANWL